MTVELLLALIREKIARYKAVYPKALENADTNPGQAYELGRLDGLVEVLKEYEKRKNLLLRHTHDSGDGSCPLCESQGVSKEFLLRRMSEGREK
jgi:hypothetical protein